MLRVNGASPKQTALGYKPGMSPKNVVILGAGMVGSAMAADLAGRHDFQVTVADGRAEALERVQRKLGVRVARADLSTREGLLGAAGQADLVLGALASTLGLQTLRTLLEAGKTYCDISFMAENAWELDELAKKHGATAVVDCGVAPGVSNLLAGYATTLLESTERIEIYVGGLPAERRWPFEYKAGFAPHDVLEEYTRPSRVVEHGQVVVKEALSEPELMDFPVVGTLEAFNTDGLRSLAYNLQVPFMKEKTLRYPGHIELMRVFRHTGLFSKEPLEVGGVSVRPLDVTAALLFPKWAFGEGEADVTVMRVLAEGLRGGRRTRLTWDLFDRYDPTSGLRSMSRTTGFAATSMLALMAKGQVSGPGVFPPEVLARRPEVAQAFLGEYQSRGIQVHHRAEPI
ncbi:MAG TPA: saccharopine dehydrogenase C-terminal domain-containing protein [Myxococcales bacterium]|nr:saccharopine dehydrogenase C-terminal domain-containing protein [Myxococcales bacterium]